MASVAAVILVAAHALAEPCAGDCNGDGIVTIDELITAVNVDLGVAPPDTCPAGTCDAIGCLTRIIDNLADFANLGLGQAAITPARVDPDQLAEEVVGEVKEAARGARLHLEVRRSGSGPVVADARKLRQALANVVQNAVKFSPHGGEVLVEVARAAGKLRFSVYDQGPGVPTQARERIFEPLNTSQRVGEARSAE